RITRRGVGGVTRFAYVPAITTDKPLRSSVLMRPVVMRQESAKSQVSFVDDPSSWRSPSHRQGQTASQLQASKYVPATAHDRSLVAALSRMVEMLTRPVSFVPSLDILRGPCSTESRWWGQAT